MTTERPTNLSRRRFIQAGAGGIAGLGLSGSILAACGGDGGSSDGKTSSGTKRVKIGVIGPFSGPGAFIGRIIDRSLKVGVEQIKAEGGIGGYLPDLDIRDTGLEASNGVKAYQEMAGDPDIIGVLWCGAPGLQESLGQITRDGLPVIGVFNDMKTLGLLYPEGKARSLFQMIQSDEQAMENLADYCKNDRGFTKVALIFDTVLEEGSDKAFDKACEAHGLENVGVERFKFGDSDFGTQIGRLKDSGSNALFVWGLAPETSLIVKEIAKQNGSYVDRDTALDTGAWKPQIIGSPGGTGEKTWVQLAGNAARPGTLTSWTIAGLVTNPSFPVRDWTKKYLDEEVTGGEDFPLNGLAMLLQAAELAGSTKREAIVEALESGHVFQYASPVGFSYTEDRHLALEKDDLILVTLERPPENPPYVLGKEFEEVLPPGYEGPVHLIDFTLERNRAKYPDVIQEALDSGYGTWSDISRQKTQARVDACRAVH